MRGLTGGAAGCRRQRPRSGGCCGSAVKDNQPGLFAALDALDWERTPIAHLTHDRGHGRDETRTL